MYSCSFLCLLGCFLQCWGYFSCSLYSLFFNFSLSFLSYILPFLPVPAPQANRIRGKFLIWADCLPSSRTLVKLQNAPHIPLILFPAFTIKDDQSFMVWFLLIPFLLICVWLTPVHIFFNRSTNFWQLQLLSLLLLRGYKSRGRCRRWHCYLSPALASVPQEHTELTHSHEPRVWPWEQNTAWWRVQTVKEDLAVDGMEQKKLREEGTAADGATLGCPVCRQLLCWGSPTLERVQGLRALSGNSLCSEVRACLSPKFLPSHNWHIFVDSFFSIMCDKHLHHPSFPQDTRL